MYCCASDEIMANIFSVSAPKVLTDMINRIKAAVRVFALVFIILSPEYSVNGTIQAASIFYFTSLSAVFIPYNHPFIKKTGGGGII